MAYIRAVRRVGVDGVFGFASLIPYTRRYCIEVALGIFRTIARYRYIVGKGFALGNDFTCKSYTPAYALL